MKGAVDERPFVCCRPAPVAPGIWATARGMGDMLGHSRFMGRRLFRVLNVLIPTSVYAGTHIAHNGHNPSELATQWRINPTPALYLVSSALRAGIMGTHRQLGKVFSLGKYVPYVRWGCKQTQAWLGCARRPKHKGGNCSTTRDPFLSPHTRGSWVCKCAAKQGHKALW